LVDVRRT